jgi:2-hydroxychromene-2-carboxylate isomerase
MNDVEFWFDFSSPYAYFASVQIEEVAQRHSRQVIWKPFLLGPAFKVTGMQPLSRTPLRGDYARRDWTRLARMLGIEFTLPDAHPVVTLAPGRAFYWIQERQPDIAVQFARRVFHAYYVEELDIGVTDVVLEVAAELGVERVALAEALQDERLKQRFREAGDEALSRGIFGSPFFMVDDEPFWGSDRVPMIDRWLATGGW